ncbi:MAG: LacI family DNA-binding transcriptional regulator [Actinomycetota bacterium]
MQRTEPSIDDPLTGRPSTLHDVAARVGVSPRTVSRVVRDEGGFSEATRQRVLEVVEELNYRPNVHARGLISGRSGTIAFVAPVLSDPFFPELAEGVQRAARAQGLTVLFAMSDSDPEVQDEVLTSLEGHRPDGVVIFPAAGGPAPLVPFLDRGLPMVIVDTVLHHRNAVSVCSDLAAGAVSAVRHLLDRGCRQLAMLTDFPTRNLEQERRQAFLATLPPDMEPVVVESEITLQGGRDATADLVERRPDVDGLFCFNDVMAIGAVQAIQAAGRTVPDDVAVVGFDDIQMGAVISPSLTTVRIDRERVGAEAVQQVVALADGSSTGEMVVLPVDLIERDSA